MNNIPIPDDPIKAQLWKVNQSRAQKGKPRNAGESNPFFGRTHSVAQKKLWSIQRRGKYLRNWRLDYLPTSITKEALQALYQNNSVQKIAEILKTTEWYVLKGLVVHDIPQRNRSDVVKLANKNRVCKGRIVSDEGYVYILNKGHHRANKKGYVAEHILVWEETNKQRLPRDQVVHHINGVKDDNRPDNLKALPRKEHHYALLLQETQKKLREVEGKLCNIQT